jgi:Zn-dependent peptidase ImmA (M78 family)
MGLTQEAFARSLGLSSEFISLLESGKRAPSLNTLARIATYFHRDASYFLGAKEPAFTVLFRAAAIGLSPEARLELEHFQRYVEDYLRLEEATGRRPELAPLYSGNLSPERLAAEERRRLGLGDEPVRDLFALLERNGLRILRRPFPEKVEISGVFVFLEVHNAAFALINSVQTLCRQIFTAAHEYCHYLKDRHDAPLIDTQEIFNHAPRSESNGGRKGKSAAPNSAKEQFAQEFAAHFLMPPTKVREFVEKEYGSGLRLSYDDVLLIKRYFGTSAQAMLRALRGLDLINAAQHEDFLGLDPVAREREVFGASAEEYGPASFFISDRYRLLEQENRSIKGETRRGPS